MKAFFLVSAIAIGVLLLLPLVRIVRGPTIFDRLVGLSMMATKTTVLLMLMGYAVGRPDMYVDISLGYGLALLIGTLITAKYLEAEAARRRQAAPVERTPTTPANESLP